MRTLRIIHLTTGFGKLQLQITTLSFMLEHRSNGITFSYSDSSHNHNKFDLSSSKQFLKSQMLVTIASSGLYLGGMSCVLNLSVFIF